jgi:5-methylthioadenosine/S-adenosylhomocysteine deaminase
MQNGFRGFTRRDLMTASAAFGAATIMPSSLLAQTPASDPNTTALPARGEFVIRGATILTMDPTLGDIAKGDIHVRDGAIVAIGPNIPANGAEIIDAANMIAMPGMIDTHWHMWGSVARNMAGEDAKTGYFLFARAVGDVFTPEDNARGVRMSLAEAIHGGITTVHNWSHNLPKPEFADAELAAHKAYGARALFGYGYAGVGMVDQPINLSDLERVQKHWIATSEGLTTLGICSRGPESNNAEITKREWDTARKMGLRISTHMGTSASRVKAREGVKALAAAGLLGPDVVLVHDTNTSLDDIDLVAKTKTFISMSPYTEMRTGFGIPPILQMLDRGVSVALSIDTTVLAGNADFFAIMKAMQNVGDGSKPSEFALTPRKVLEMATIEGARALGIDDRVGSLKPGKRADIILVRADDLNMAPANDPVRMVVQSAQPSNVDTTIIDGRILKRGGKLLHVDTKKVIADAAETMSRVRAGVEKVLREGGVSVVR